MYIIFASRIKKHMLDQLERKKVNRKQAHAPQGHKHS